MGRKANFLVHDFVFTEDQIIFTPISKRRRKVIEIPIQKGNWKAHCYSNQTGQIGNVIKSLELFHESNYAKYFMKKGKRLTTFCMGDTPAAFIGQAKFYKNEEYAPQVIGSVPPTQDDFIYLNNLETAEERWIEYYTSYIAKLKEPFSIFREDTGTFIVTKVGCGGGNCKIFTEGPSNAFTFLKFVFVEESIMKSKTMMDKAKEKREKDEQRKQQRQQAKQDNSN